MAQICAAPGAGYTRAADSKGPARTNGTRIITHSAISAFIAGLPDFHRGRIVTSGSAIDSWRRKPAAILDRLARERIAHAWRAAQ